MLDANGKVRRELFRWDGLHMNPRGYALWTAIIKPILLQRFPVQKSEVHEQYLSDPNSVGFDIEPQRADDGSQQWLATCTAKGKTAKFRIELDQAKSIKDDEPVDFDIQSGKGRFVGVPGSDAIGLLADLKNALEAKTFPKHSKRVAILPFTYVTFGNNESQASGGGFSPKPAGHWTPMKIFIGEGEQEGQVFVNINAVIKKGQFSMKDQDYGDIVLAQLASVL
jgi:hypothetical protein